MNVRPIQFDDYKKIKRIHEKFYEREFTLPDFTTHFSGAFIIEDNEEIVTLCALRHIAEIIAVTNKDCSTRARRAALLTGSEVITFVANKEGFNQAHAFVQDPVWESLLNRAGFNPTKGKSLVLEI